MNIERRRWFRAAVTVGFCFTAAAPLFAQAPSATPSTAVMASLTVKADADRAQIMKAMPDEIRATVKLYLDGKIQQRYSRSDGRGVVFVLNCSTVAEAKSLTDNDDIGGIMGRTAFVDRPGPHGMIIVLADKRNVRPSSPNHKRWSTKSSTRSA